MTSPTQEQQRAWMAQWRAASTALARVRQAECESVDLARVASDLEDACVASVLTEGLSATSGLVEQQRAFHRRRQP